MFNSGGKNIFSKIGRAVKGMAGGLFEPTQGEVTYPVPELFPLAKPQVERSFANIDRMRDLFGSAGEELMAGARGLSTDIDEAALARRMREALMPQLAARGLATGQQGISADVDIAGKLAEGAFQRNVSRQQVLQQAAAGMAALNAMPEELRAKILDIIVRQSGSAAPIGESQFGQIGGFMGELGKLLGGAGTLVAAGGGCWVAEVLYGKTSPYTALARQWVATHDTLFTRAYQKYGKQWAAFLERHTWLKPIVKPIWDNMWQKQVQVILWQL